MDEKFTRSYSILNLKAGASWDELRGAYRSLVKTWHPDRTQSDGERRRAEEKTKEITRAYKILADYYRKHGQTPTDGDLDSWPMQNDPPTAQTPENQTAERQDNVDWYAGKTAYQTTSAAARHPDSWKTLATLIAAALLLYLWLLDDPSDYDSNSDAFPGSPVIDAPQTDTSSISVSQSEAQFFTRGSKIGDVYSIQGIPSKIENNIWHYGKSKVYFINGSVTHWESHPDNPLKAGLDIEPTNRNRNIEFFTRGSTKAEVRAVQGTPWRQTEHEWAYGSSRIYFNGDLVTGWEETPLHPLKIK